MDEVNSERIRFVAMAFDADALPLTTPVNVFIELALMSVPLAPLTRAPLETLAYFVTDGLLEDLESRPYLPAEKAFVLCSCIFFI